MDITITVESEEEADLNKSTNSLPNPLDKNLTSVDDNQRSADDNTLDTWKNDETNSSSVKMSLAFALFTCISMIIGILTVCFTSPKHPTICRLTFKPTIKNAIGSDSRPYSIAVGDFNQDNKLDIVVANSGQDNIGIFIGNGNGTFASQITYSTGSKSRPYSVVINDFNNDKLLDLAVANYGTNNIGIFLGKEDGTFTNQTTFSTGSSHPIYINVGDFNNDNKSDIVVVNYGTNSISIYLGRGDGTFSHEIKYFMGYDSIPYALAVSDFDNDKFLDLAIANYGTNNIAILFGNGNGSFVTPVIYPTNYGSQPTSIAIADFNNDQKLDLVVTNYGTHNIGIFFGFNNGSFDQQQLFITDVLSHPQYVTVGDLNNDNQTDIVIIDSINGYVRVLPGYGNGSFSNLTTYTTGSHTFPDSAVIGDFNNDNQSDIAVVSYEANNVLILIGYSQTFSVTQTRYSVGSNSHPTSVAVGDFNSDQRLDIVVAKLTDDSIGIILGHGDGSFATEITYSFQSGSSPICVCVGDFNNDNRSDIVVANYNAHTVGILLGAGNGSFANMITYSTGVKAFPIFVTIGDFNDDHALDIAVANFRIDNIAIFLGFGNGNFADVVTYSSGGGSDPSAIVVGDFNNDHQLDLAVANSQNGNVGILFGNNDGTFRTVITYTTGFQSHPDSITAGDLNKDTWLDIIIADSTSDNIAILFGFANGTFGTPVSYTDNSFSNPYGIILGDVNYDNRLDIIVTNFGTDHVGVLTGLANGSFILGRSYPLISGSGPKGVVIGDFNNNTRWDIVIVESGIGSINLLVRYIGAVFQSDTMYSTGSGTHPYAVAIGDFNNDNRTDIVAANSGSNNVGVLRGYGNGTFAPQKTFDVGPDTHPQYVIVGDFNKDNKTDIATANSYGDSITVLLGVGNGSFTNKTIYSTQDSSQPYSLAMGDFNNDYVWDFVVANKGRDNIGILLGYNYNSFKNQQTYSNKFSLRPSSIISRDFNNDSYLDIAASFAANDSVGIIFGFGNGLFSDLIMYSVGYNSYPYEIVSGDVNNDNILDIVVANAGSGTLGILLGRGDGIFAPVMTFSTGYDSQPYGAAPGDFNNDKKLDFVVANYRSNSIGVMLGHGNGSFSTVMIYSTIDGSRPQSVAVDDFNQDNIADIVVANYRGDNMGVFINNGDGTFQNQVVYSTGYQSMPTFIITNDFNNDNISDVAVSNKNNDNVGIFYGRGNGTFAPIVFYSTGDGSSPQCIRSGDFNNDKAMDIAVCSPGTNKISILYGLGDGRFIMGPYYSTGTKSGPISLNVGDFDRDDRLDITTANYLVNNIGVHISYSSVNFGVVTTYSTGSGSTPYSVAVSDFNNDGCSDVVVANYGTNNIGILLGHGNGTFAAMVSYLTGDGSSPIAVVVGDLNRDNRSDIVVVNSASNNLYFFLGLGDGTFSLVSIYSTGLGSLPYGVAIGDLNNDNIPDIAAVTAGTNKALFLQGYGNGTFGNETSYTAGYNYDLYAVAVMDFNGDGWLDIAIANYGADYVEVLLKTC